MGFGMNSYLEIMLYLMGMMTVIALISIPSILIYSSYNDLSNVSSYSMYSLGNMGGASIYCGQSSFTSNYSVIPISCSTGVITLDAKSKHTGEPIFETGIIPKSSDSDFYCKNESFKDPANCSSFLDRDKVKKWVNDHCSGKSSCMIKNELNEFVDKTKPGFNVDECSSDFSQIFI